MRYIYIFLYLYTRMIWLTCRRSLVRIVIWRFSSLSLSLSLSLSPFFSLSLSFFLSLSPFFTRSHLPSLPPRPLFFFTPPPRSLLRIVTYFCRHTWRSLLSRIATRNFPIWRKHIRVFVYMIWSHIYILYMYIYIHILWRRLLLRIVIWRFSIASALALPKWV